MIKQIWSTLVLFAGIVSAPCVAEYQVGIATVDITPSADSLTAGEIFMGGYGLWKDRGPAAGIHDPLSARVFCIRDEAEGICIVILDSLGVPGPVIEQIANHAGEHIGLNPDRILIGATHTHAAPDLLGLWGGSPETYKERLIEQTTDAIVAAFRTARLAHLYYATSRGKAHNRRGWAFTDDEIVVLQAVDAQTNQPMGTLINFAAHPVVSPRENLLLSSDYIHYLRERAEALTGVPVVYANGAIGDVTPMGERDGDFWANARTYGESIANKAIEALEGRMIIDGGMTFQRREFTTGVDNFVLSLAQVLGIADDFSTGPIWNVKVRSSVARFSLGPQVDAVAVPGEALTRLALDIKQDMNAPARLFLGLSGGSLGYFVPADEWKTGRNSDYEESVSLGKDVAAQIHALFPPPLRVIRRGSRDSKCPHTACALDPGPGSDCS